MHETYFSGITVVEFTGLDEAEILLLFCLIDNLDDLL
jgi:hypothetical protein